MRAVIQRVRNASVTISGNLSGSIEAGLLVFLGIVSTDNEEDVNWLAAKIVSMRLFDDENGVMNLSTKDINGSILLVSQFTLYASTKKGNRPSYIRAAPPELAQPLYSKMIGVLEKELGKTIATGEFGADMQVSLLNDGPVTILVDTVAKE